MSESERTCIGPQKILTTMAKEIARARPEFAKHSENKNTLQLIEIGLAVHILHAIRNEPTPRMIEAGYDAANKDIGGDWVGRVEIQSVIGKTVWRAMIDAALNEGGGITK